MRKFALITIAVLFAIGILLFQTNRAKHPLAKRDVESDRTDVNQPSSIVMRSFQTESKAVLSPRTQNNIRNIASASRAPLQPIKKLSKSPIDAEVKKIRVNGLAYKIVPNTSARLSKAEDATAVNSSIPYGYFLKSNQSKTPAIESYDPENLMVLSNDAGFLKTIVTGVFVINYNDEKEVKKLIAKLNLDLLDEAEHIQLTFAKAKKGQNLKDKFLKLQNSPSVQNVKYELVSGKLEAK